MARLIQTPSPASHLLCYCGDILEFRLESDSLLKGTFFLRTNLGNFSTMLRERIRKIEEEKDPDGCDWTNIEMEKLDEYTGKIRILLDEPGHFEAKCFFLTEEGQAVWAEGNNVHINVEPSVTCCANSIYCAFVRQFGRNKLPARKSEAEGITPELLKKMDSLGYTVIPPSGTFRDLIRELDHIFDRLHCRILHLLPVNPTPTVYGRMGRYGSPYASLDFTAVNPEYAEFDRSATPLDQFMELTDAVHRKNGKLFIDIAVNHTGWAAKLHETHPRWLLRDPDGSIHSPGAWGVTWGDLTELDHSKKELWIYLAEVFRTWCMRGVDGFRCDAGYMIPEEAWTYIIAKVRSEFPDTVFLLEGLGGDPAVTNALLDRSNMNWAYSELFQNYSRQQIEGYLNYAWDRSAGDGIMVNYAETHDNDRLAKVSRRYASLRTLLAALTSKSGAFGFTNGVEFFAEEKVDVHDDCALNFSASENQIDLIGKVNTLLAAHPAFHCDSEIFFADSSHGEGLVICRNSAKGKHPLIIVANLNTESEIRVQWNPTEASFDADNVFDLLSSRPVSLVRGSGGKRSLRLAGGEVLCLAPVNSITGEEGFVPGDEESMAKLRRKRTRLQNAACMAMKILHFLRKSPVAKEGEEGETLGQALLQSPYDFFVSAVEKCGIRGPLPLVRWRYPEDRKRHVMIPPGYFLLVEAPCRFRACIRLKGKVHSVVRGLVTEDDRSFFAFLPPPEGVNGEEELEAELLTSVFRADRPERGSSPLLFLASELKNIPLHFSGTLLRKSRMRYLRGNGRGGFAFLPLLPDRLMSRYDSLFLANLNPDYPVDRHILLRRFRFRAIGEGESRELTADSLCSFHIASDGSGVWTYELPVGGALSVTLLVKVTVLPGENSVLLTVKRVSHKEKDLRGGGLKENDRLRFLAGVDLEDRNYHGETKASQGPENFFPGKVSCFDREGGGSVLIFRAAEDRILDVRSSSGTFLREDRWTYNVFQEDEAARGLPDTTDLYSPGAFRFSLVCGESISFLVREGSGEFTQENFPAIPENAFDAAQWSIGEILEDSLAQFVVKREENKSVIAGYPWFLDWGRDTLIVARGLLASGRFKEDVRSILLEFASYAEHGTIPNMICGGNAENRDTADAPLWLFVLCADLCGREKSFAFLDTLLPRTGLTVRETLLQMAESLLQGTPNNIKADPESLLLYSPAHFTWMDTNYPAGTPREGYPVEIQALWFAALTFLAKFTGDARWKSLAEKVRASFLRYFPLAGKGYLSDCLHAPAGVPASGAVPDDHLRCNQLYGITLGILSGKEQRPLAESVLRSTASLLVPGGMRSLSDRETEYLLPVYGNNGNSLNDPARPYRGHYEGDEDTSRKVAYHNGTAWTLPFPLYSEACFLLYGKDALAEAQAVLGSSGYLFSHGVCVGQLPEIMDGDYPHTPRGCQAQAWGISELFRVWRLLEEAKRHSR
ncbi:MAG: glycogen debranching enzyme N-terminal domain-containing protein [Lentisphaeria bacterium]|nr:glycogen debranching enzyme N-terminal domain-containing protein [Lentisphaeria bacterium]